METYNLNHKIRVKLFPEGEIIFLNYCREFAPKKHYTNQIFKTHHYNPRTHYWIGQMHEFMGIFGKSMQGGGTSCCATTIELLGRIEQ